MIARYGAISFGTCLGNNSGNSLTRLMSGGMELALTIMQSTSCSVHHVVCIARSMVSSSYMPSVVSSLVTSSAVDAMLVVVLLLVPGLCYGMSENHGILFG